MRIIQILMGIVIPLMMMTGLCAFISVGLLDYKRVIDYKKTSDTERKPLSYPNSIIVYDDAIYVYYRVKECVNVYDLTGSFLYSIQVPVNDGHGSDGIYIREGKLTISNDSEFLYIYDGETFIERTNITDEDYKWLDYNQSITEYEYGGVKYYEHFNNIYKSVDGMDTAIIELPLYQIFFNEWIMFPLFGIGMVCSVVLYGINALLTRKFNRS